MSRTTTLMSSLLVTIFTTPQAQITNYDHTQVVPIGIKQTQCDDGLRTCTIQIFGKYNLHSNTTIETSSYKINFLPSQADKLLFDTTRESGVYFHYTRSPNEMLDILEGIDRVPSKILDFNELIVISIRNQIPSETVKLSNSYELYELKSPKKSVLIMNFRRIEWYSPDLTNFVRIEGFKSNCEGLTFSRQTAAFLHDFE